MGVKKINTSGYHPQTDGLVEKFNSTLVNLIAKCCETKKRDWDIHLPYLLFAYRTMVQESTQESPFYLLYGRDYMVDRPQVFTVSIMRVCRGKEHCRFIVKKSTQIAKTLRTFWTCVVTSFPDTVCVSRPSIILHWNPSY